MELRNGFRRQIDFSPLYGCFSKSTIIPSDVDFDVLCGADDKSCCLMIEFKMGGEKKSTGQKRNLSFYAKCFNPDGKTRFKVLSVTLSGEQNDNGSYKLDVKKVERVTPEGEFIEIGGIQNTERFLQSTKEWSLSLE